MRGLKGQAHAARASATAFVLLAGLSLPPQLAHSHGTEARYVEVVNWKKDRISRVFATNTVHFTGMQAARNNNAQPTAGMTPAQATEQAARGGGYRTAASVQIRDIEGKACVVGQQLAIDVDDRYGFDIDETVTLTITYATDFTTPFLVAWDQNGGTGHGVTAETAPEKGASFRSSKFTLNRARLAGQGAQGADIAIGTQNGIALCDIQVERTNTTQVATSIGGVQLTITDGKTGASVPARIGIYDATGRAPLASDDALMLQRFADDLRMLPVNDRTFWPSANRSAFYVDGSYQAQLPEGTYELVVTRGPEFRANHSKFTVKKNQTSKVAVSLQRFADLPSEGWWSGDAHIHLTRDEVADPVIWGFVAAEDVYVGNLLEMGNIAALHFHQPKAWGKASRFERDGHFIVSGQEDPRTGHLGHTIHHNIERPIRLSSSEYFLYDKVFEESKRQGGISGFAHMGWGTRDNQQPQMNRGLTLLAHTGLVNFIEVLQGGRLMHDGWYRLLNLGYRVNPAAGSDWPYSDFPGVVRNYVKLDGPLNLDNWFEAYRAGRTYVTNGPFLDLTVNGRGMGEELRVKRGTRLDVVLSTRLNPDVDKLDRLELVVLGDVAQTQAAAGKDRASIRKEIVAERSMWIAARSFGSKQEPRNMTIAHSAPIYVVVEGEPTWKADAVPSIVAELREQLSRILVEPIEPVISGGPEPWESRKLLAEEWLLQRPLLRPRVEAADAAYQKLLTQLATYPPARSSAGGGGG